MIQRAAKRCHDQEIVCCFSFARGIRAFLCSTGIARASGSEYDHDLHPCTTKGWTCCVQPRWAGWNKKAPCGSRTGLCTESAPGSAFFARRFGSRSGRGLGREQHAGEGESGADAADGGEVEEHDGHVQQPVHAVETGEPDAEQDDAADNKKEEPHCRTDLVIH